MTEIEIEKTGKKQIITVIDPRTDLDWASDLIGNANPKIIGYNEEGNIIMGQEEFDWWENYCIEYQKADYLVYRFFSDLEKNCWNNFKTGYPEDAYQEFDRLKARYHDFICGIEFNEIPAAMTDFVGRN